MVYFFPVFPLKPCMHFSSSLHTICHMSHHLITHMIFRQQYKSLHSSLTNVHWSPAISSLLGSNKTGTQLWHTGIRRHNSVTKCILFQSHKIIKINTLSTHNTNHKIFKAAKHLSLKNKWYLQVPHPVLVPNTHTDISSTLHQHLQHS